MSKFYCEFDLKQLHLSNKIPANHQKEALAKLKEWFRQQHVSSAGGILALPTGAGKTFTASRFLCSSLFHDGYDGPISKGYKILWLAHTHHLLEQAFYTLKSDVGRISESKKQLNVRVVSPGHCPVHSIKSSDDFVIITLQTLRGACNRKDTQLEPFLKSAEDKLFVVFDEAHHSPAYSYRKLLLDLRVRFNNKMWFLGLTATPTYTDEKKRGWLKELFPQEVIYPENGKNLIDKLIAERILAKPEFEQHRTKFDIEFDEREYKKWVNTYRDLPEEIIKKLAENEDRNRFIAETYVKYQERYGQTIIFADRWYQCETLRTFLQERGVKAGVVFHKVDNSAGGTLAENHEVLKQFRSGELKVLINIQMLTEGTDVPNIQTIFLTRQTTSSILLTQMIGRALRGSQFGGTDKAYVVSFIDDWKQIINWGKSDFSGDKNDEKIEYGEQPDLELIAIELIRRWARQVSEREKGIPIDSSFISLLPLGWYSIEFQTLVSESEDNQVHQLLLVFDNEKESYERFIQSLREAKIEDFAEIDVEFSNKLNQIQAWQQQFFPKLEEYLGSNLLRNIFHIARHMAQNDGTPPKWFDFEQRKMHDLEAIARKFVEDDIGTKTINQKLKFEYERADLYWNVIYPKYERFKEHYDDLINIILNSPPSPPPDEPIDLGVEEEQISKEIRDAVKKRDNYRCLCCGEDRQNLLQIDHILSRYYGGSDLADNLQTLCKICNQAKETETINFRIHHSPLNLPKAKFPHLKSFQKWYKIDAHKQLQLSIHRSVNFLYYCNAVKKIDVDIKGRSYQKIWQIDLHAGNDPRWLLSHYKYLFNDLLNWRQKAGFSNPESIIINAPSFDVVAPIRI